MTVKIDSPEDEALVNELARLRKVSEAEAVVEAVRETLAREKKGREKASVEELMAIARECAAHMDPTFRSEDHATLLYDEDGLPK